MSENLGGGVQAGDQYALARLLYDNYEIVFRYLIKFTLNKTVAEDVAQETMIKAIENYSKYDSTKAVFSTWLIAIARNVYLDHLRKKKREDRFIEEDILSLEPDEHGREYDDSMERVLEALSHLTEDIRVPIVLKHYHGYSLEEIAKLMSIPLGTVKSRIHNGLKSIRKELE